VRFDDHLTGCRGLAYSSFTQWISLGWCNYTCYLWRWLGPPL